MLQNASGKVAVAVVVVVLVELDRAIKFIDGGDYPDNRIEHVHFR